jgi:hypothetical protein
LHWYFASDVIRRARTAILALLFFGLITPIGLVLRLLGRDALGRRHNESHSTYWTLKSVPARLRSYYRQF